MSEAKGRRYIEKFLKKADRALQDGVKRADEALDDAVELGAITAKQAAKASKDLRGRAKKERIALQKRGAEKLSKGVSAARRISADPEADLATLEKLGQLRKAKVITEKEFQAKKKKILDRI